MTARRRLAGEAGGSLRGGTLRGGQQDVLDVVQVERRHQPALAVVALEDLHGRFLADQSNDKRR